MSGRSSRQLPLLLTSISGVAKQLSPSSVLFCLVVVVSTLCVAPVVLSARQLEGLFDVRYLDDRGGTGVRCARATEEGRQLTFGRLAFDITGSPREGLDGLIRLDFGTDLTTGAASVGGGGAEPSVGLNEAWLDFNPTVGALACRVGLMPLPFSVERTGPMGMTTWTITPSVLGSYWERHRFVGFEFRKGYQVVGHHFDWRYGVGSGGDGATIRDYVFRFDDRHGRLDEQRERDGNFSTYFHIGKFQSNSCKRGRLSWHTGFLYTNGDDQAAEPTRRADDSRVILFDAQFWRRSFGVLVQGALATSRQAGLETQEADISHVTCCWRFCSRGWATFRYDHWNREERSGNVLDRGHGLTAAVTIHHRENSFLQLECLRPVVSVGPEPISRNQWQLRLTQSF